LSIGSITTGVVFSYRSLYRRLNHLTSSAIMDIRVLRPSDIPHVQMANITNLPENYFCKYYLYHAMSWPQLSYVAVDVSLRCFW
jgi:ribosomal protein S18 acetylase RimI-like enzyme